MTDEDAIHCLVEYRSLLEQFDINHDKDIRREISRRNGNVEHILSMSGRSFTMTLTPPPAVGGLILRNVNPFGVIFDHMYGSIVRRNMIDMINTCIGDIESGVLKKTPRLEPKSSNATHKNYAFIVMAMDSSDGELEDKLEAIQEAAAKLSIKAERIDDQISNRRITDRVLESIACAEFVICDLTKERPNVYYEAGYAQGLGKLPIYLAKLGTDIHFDVKDYPIVLYRNLKELKEKLTERLRGLADDMYR